MLRTILTLALLASVYSPCQAATAGKLVPKTVKVQVKKPAKRKPPITPRIPLKQFIKENTPIPLIESTGTIA